MWIEIEATDPIVAVAPLHFWPRAAAGLRRLRPTWGLHNTAPLGALRTTIEHATIIIGGLQRGRARLGG